MIPSNLNDTRTVSVGTLLVAFLVINTYALPDRSAAHTHTKCFTYSRLPALILLAGAMSSFLQGMAFAAAQHVCACAGHGLNCHTQSDYLLPLRVHNPYKHHLLYLPNVRGLNMRGYIFTTQKAPALKFAHIQPTIFPFCNDGIALATHCQVPTIALAVSHTHDKWALSRALLYQ